MFEYIRTAAARLAMLSIGSFCDWYGCCFPGDPDLLSITSSSKRCRRALQKNEQGKFLVPGTQSDCTVQCGSVVVLGTQSDCTVLSGSVVVPGTQSDCTVQCGSVVVPGTQSDCTVQCGSVVVRGDTR